MFFRDEFYSIWSVSMFQWKKLVATNIGFILISVNICISFILHPQFCRWQKILSTMMGMWTWLQHYVNFMNLKKQEKPENRWARCILWLQVKISIYCIFVYLNKNHKWFIKLFFYWSVYLFFAELWLNWIQDEQKVCATDEERQYIVNLFERAVKDYTSKHYIFYYSPFS